MGVVYIVLMITNLGLGPNIETTGVVGASTDRNRAMSLKTRAEQAMKREGRRFVVVEEQMQ